MLAGRKVDDEPSADASPTGFFAMPLNATAGPRQLLTVVQAAARAHDPVGKVCTRALEDVARRPRVQVCLRR